MNELAYLAIVKCYEARDRLRAAQEALTTLSELERLEWRKALESGDKSLKVGDTSPEVGDK